LRPSETAWLFSAYQLTFAAFLLLVRDLSPLNPMTRANNAMKSGRISDVYSPKPAFVSGAMILALTHLGGGFVRQKIALLVLRALGGIGGALTIPSALSMIVALFPDQRSQGRAIAIFGGTGGVGNG
jgi:MFS family permease